MKMLAGGLGAGGSDEEDEKDIDLSDSDQDESWTPFKEKDSKEKGGKGSDDKKQSNGPRYRQVTNTSGFFSPVLRFHEQQNFRNLEFRREILEFSEKSFQFDGEIWNFP